MRFRGSRLLGIALAAAALAAPAGAGASTTIGSPLTSAAQVSTCGTATFTNTAVGIGTLAAPYDGVIVRWRMKLQTGGGSSNYNLRVLRPAGGSNYTGAGTGPAQTAPSAGVNVLALPTPLPVHAGDIIAVDCPNGAPAASATSPPAASKLAFFNPLVADASTRTPNNQLSGEEELINADVVGVPAIASVGPASGGTAGGTTVTITGSRLADVTGVSFGGVAASAFTVVNDTQLTATAPAHAAGAVDVRASSAAGSSPIVAADAFTYVAPPPAISALSQAHRSWKARKGTAFSFTLNEPASVSLAFTQTLGGRRVHGRCVPQSKRNRAKPACKRTLKRGTVTVSGASGANKLPFKGRISRSKRLGAGRYTVTIVATSPAGLKSALSFTILG
jgi:IPT/TIG domain-containing protein